MEVCLAVLGEVKVDDDIHGLDIDTAREEVGTYEIAAHPIPEVVEHTVTVRLQHFGMRVEAGVAELGHLFGKQLDAVGRVAENNGLVNLEL